MVEITCPSGLKVGARKWKVGDQDLLVNADLQRTGRVLIAMARAVTTKDDRNPDVGLIDPGPYGFTSEIEWSKVAQADILSFLMQLRASKLSEFSFETQCVGCRSKIEVEVDAADLDLKAPMPQAGIDHLATGEPFVHYLPTDDGVEAKTLLRLLRASDMPRLAKAQRQMGLAEAHRFQKAMHVVKLFVPGEDEPLSEPKDVLDWLSDQDEETMASLEDAVIEREGDPVTQVDVVCGHCQTDNEAIIPFVVEFFLPRTRRRRSSSGRSRT